MNPTQQALRVAVWQAAPVIMDAAATVDKTVHLIARAAASDAQLVVFPEVFIPAYPRGLSFGFVVGSRTEAGRRDWQRYYDNSILVPGPETEQIGEAAREACAYVVIGVTERDRMNRTLYCTLLYFGPDGSLLGTHRKLKPTGSERLIWGEGDGSTLTVIDTPFGRMGGLICWENYMVLARAAMYQQGVRIYLAPTADFREVWQSTMRHIAVEGRCFVIGCNQYVEKSMYPHDLHYRKDLDSQPEVMCPGGSCIVDPYGEYLDGPLFGEEGMLIADLDLGALTRTAMDFDPIGHYERPDVFRLEVTK
ncbi:carbon-nitrogen hydrolase family protein [Desulfofustis limnaeus]|uniref:Nitrilase n=1 Tax=Desulfofustis limnaeus TaxID=2740163 RepID=A0ABM7W551_9BACT|nr:carbon-nitrogen hydrolase family protein [Desulfofustis limnaeus]BDD86045.1 nitrilase [Desulfofustis limnaeus]